MRKVLVFGTFDGLHNGHVQFFRSAKKFGTHLVVVLAKDSTITKLKGHPPTHPESQRLAAVQSLPEVDEALLGSTGDKYAVIEQVAPDVICLGYDQHSFDAKLAEELQQRGLSHIEIHRIPSFHKHREKSSIVDPSKFEQRLAAKLKLLGVRCNASLVVAVSGGPDSMALLTALTHLSSPWNLHLVVCHVNYGLRGSDSESDESFLLSHCNKLGIPLEVRRLSGTLTSESDMRSARYAFFEEQRQHHGCSAILVAHTFNDQVETVLLRFLRGTGVKGLSAIPEQRGYILRPFLQVHRDEIERYLQYRKQDYRLDRSNRETVYARNKVRHELLPLLRKEYNPNIDQRLWEMAQTAADDYAYLRSQASAQLSLLSEQPHPHTLVIQYTPWRELPLAMQRETLRLAIEAVRGSVEGISLTHLEEAREMLTNARVQGEKLLFGDLRIRESHDRIEVTMTGA